MHRVKVQTGLEDKQVPGLLLKDASILVKTKKVNYYAFANWF